MSQDINKFINDPDAAQDDPEGNLAGLGSWSESHAEAVAAEVGLSLTDDHWKIIRFLRSFYAEHGETSSARKALSALSEAFTDKGGKKYLYQLLPGGPVTQGSKLAGLPAFEHSVDESFGTAQ